MYCCTCRLCLFVVYCESQRPPQQTSVRSSAASDVCTRQTLHRHTCIAATLKHRPLPYWQWNTDHDQQPRRTQAHVWARQPGPLCATQWGASHDRSLQWRRPRYSELRRSIDRQSFLPWLPLLARPPWPCCHHPPLPGNSLNTDQL